MTVVFSSWNALATGSFKADTPGVCPNCGLIRIGIFILINFNCNTDLLSPYVLNIIMDRAKKHLEVYKIV